jgi:hypothetical protein
MRDIYYDLISQYSEEIVKFYLLFEEKRPIMLYDVQEEKIYAYPYDGYLATLSIKSQSSLKEQYAEAISRGEALKKFSVNIY